MSYVIVVYNKKPFHVSLEQCKMSNDLKNQLYKLTGVPPQFQKIFGLPGGPLQDNISLKTFPIRDGQKLLLVASTKRLDETLELNRIRMAPLNKQTNNNNNTKVRCQKVRTDEGPYLGAFSILPDEMQLFIFEFLHLKEIGRCMCVCSTWHSLLKENALWQNLYFYYFPVLREFYPSFSTSSDWRQICKMKTLYETNMLMRPACHFTFKFKVTNVCCLQTADVSQYHLKSARNSNQSEIIKRILITGNSEGDVCIFNVENKNLEKRLIGHTVGVTAVRLSGRSVVSGDRGGNLLLWDLGRSPQSLPWSPASGELVSAFPDAHNSPVVAIRINEHFLVTAAEDCPIKVWDLERGVELYRLQGHMQRITSLDLHNYLCVTSDSRGIVKLWDLRTGKCIEKFAAHIQTNSVQLCAPTLPTNLYTAGIDGYVKEWDFRSVESGPRSAYSFGAQNINAMVTDGTKVVVGLDTPYNNVVVRATYSRYFDDICSRQSNESSEKISASYTFQTPQCLTFTDRFLMVGTYWGVDVFDFSANFPAATLNTFNVEK